MAVPPVRGGVCLVFYRVAASLGGEPRRWYGRCARAATLLVVLLAAGASSAPGASPRWVATDLGTLGGNATWADDINNRGQIVGSPGFLWEHGKMKDLPLEDREDVLITDRGLIVGEADVGGRCPWHPAVLQGRRQDVLPVPGCFDNGFIDAVSERGQIVATAERTVLGDSRGILWTRR